jgi:hypothetical protein
MTRRATILLAIVGLLGAPSILLRAACAGQTCASVAAGAPGRVPFCSLPEDLRGKVAAGYRDGRSPDVLALTRSPGVVGPVTGESPKAEPWPSASPPTDTRVPVVFAGTGIGGVAPVPAGTGLEQIAPTIAEIIQLDRPFPNVRSGQAIADVAGREVPRLVLEVALKGVGTPDLESEPDGWPFLRRLLASGSGTLDGDVGSLPLDAAAALTTIGTGGTPSEHGITGRWLRDDHGDVVRAWAAGSPTSVIATLPDDLDEELGQRPLVGLVASDPSDRGIVGGDWYPEGDGDRVVIAAARPDREEAVDRLLGRAFGRDAVPDVLAVVMEGPVRSLDVQLGGIVRAARLASGGSVLVVVAGTGTWRTSAAAPVDAADLVRAVEGEAAPPEPLVVATVPGGFFLDQAALTEAHVTGQTVEAAVLAASGPRGEPLMADAFQGFAVSFGRYC